MLLNRSGQSRRPCLSLGLCLEFNNYNCTESFEPEEIIARVSLQLENHRKHKELLEQYQQFTEKLTNSLKNE
jgi:hypothetical protein